MQGSSDDYNGNGNVVANNGISFHTTISIFNAILKLLANNATTKSNFTNPNACT